jgi:hypothetical protein
LVVDFDVAAFLSETGRPASVATVTNSGRPALATMWFLFADDRFWLHSPGGFGPFVRAAERSELVAAMVETFDPAGRVIQVRVTGPAAVEGADVDRVRQIYDRYLGRGDLWTDEWREQASDPSYVLWTIEPARGAAVQYPKLEDAGGVFRWSTLGAFRRAVEAARSSTE